MTRTTDQARYAYGLTALAIVAGVVLVATGHPVPDWLSGVVFAGTGGSLLATTPTNPNSTGADTATLVRLLAELPAKVAQAIGIAPAKPEAAPVAPASLPATAGASVGG